MCFVSIVLPKASPAALLFGPVFAKCIEPVQRHFEGLAFHGGRICIHSLRQTVVGFHDRYQKCTKLVCLIPSQTLQRHQE